MDADNNSSRLSAILIWVIAAAIVCVAATWPRWHNTPSANPATSGGGAGNSMGSSAGSNHSPSQSAAAPGQPNVPTVATMVTASATASATASTPVAAPISPSSSSAAVAAAGSGSISTTAAHHTRPTPSHIGEINVPTAVEDWQHLNDKQHIALAPFVDEWAHLPDSQKRKWLAIAAVYPRMTPEEQQRLHARMLRWVQMTPDERTIARENYQMSRVLPPNARQEAWRAYEALSPAQKAKLAAAERSRRRKLVVSALPGTREPLTSRAASKNGLAGASAPLSTEKLIPLGGAANTGNTGNASGTGVGGASQPSAASPSNLSDTRGNGGKSGKSIIKNLNVGDQDRS